MNIGLIFFEFSRFVQVQDSSRLLNEPVRHGLYGGADASKRLNLVLDSR